MHLPCVTPHEYANMVTCDGTTIETALVNKSAGYCESQQSNFNRNITDLDHVNKGKFFQYLSIFSYIYLLVSSIQMFLL